MKPYLIIKDKDGKLVGKRPTMDEPRFRTPNHAETALAKALWNEYNDHLAALPSLHLDPSIKGKEGDRVDGVEQWQMEYSKHPDEEPYWIDITEKEYREQNIHIDCRITLKAVAEKPKLYCETTWGAILRVNDLGDVSKKATSICVSDPDAVDAGQYISTKEVKRYISEEDYKAMKSPDQSQEAQKQGAHLPKEIEALIRSNAKPQGNDGGCFLSNDDIVRLSTSISASRDQADWKAAYLEMKKDRDERVQELNAWLKRTDEYINNSPSEPLRELQKRIEELERENAELRNRSSNVRRSRSSGDADLSNPWY